MARPVVDGIDVAPEDSGDARRRDLQEEEHGEEIDLTGVELAAAKQRAGSRGELFTAGMTAYLLKLVESGLGAHADRNGAVGAARIIRVEAGYDPADAVVFL